MKINSLLWPMKAHYFLIFAGTAPMLPFLPVYMSQNLHLSYMGIGLIYTILPFVGLFAKAIFGAISDWFHIHKSVFLISIVVCGLSFFSIMFSPTFERRSNPKGAEVQLDCSSPMSYVLLPNSQDQQCGSTHSMNSSQLSSAICTLNCDVSSEQLKNMCSSWNANLSDCLNHNGQFSVAISVNESLDEKEGVFIPISEILFDNGTEVVSNPRCSHHYRFNCSAKCDNDWLMESWGVPKYTPISSYGELLLQSSFWILLLLIGLAWSGLAVCVVMSDTICFQLLGTEASKFGRQRLFGSIGWGLSVVLTGFVIDLTSPTGEGMSKNYTAAFALAMFFHILDFLVATRLQVKMEHRTSSSVKSVCLLLSDVRVCLFLLCCIVVGITTGVLWTYQLIMVEEVVFAWDCQFEYMKLLQGLIIGVSCFGGEVPFFFISDIFLNKLGHINALSVVMVVFGIRFILYWTVTNPWFFLPIELLNGFTFGIFCATMTSYANILGPEGARATMQGLVGALFEGVGVASGGFIGGVLFGLHGGRKMFLIVGLSSIGFGALHIILQKIITRSASLSITTDTSGEQDDSAAALKSLPAVADAENNEHQALNNSKDD